MRTRLFVVILVLGLLFGGMVTIKSCQSRQMAAMQAMQPPPTTVAVATAAETEWQPYLEAIGTLVATQGVFVSAEIAGITRFAGLEMDFANLAGVAAGELHFN